MPVAKSMESRPELPGVQFVRGIAALLVLLDHAEGLNALDKYFGRLVSNGYLKCGFVGVDLFFVLSGFIIVYVAFPTSSRAAESFSAKTFLYRRFIRIVPFLWTCVLTHFVLRYLGRGNLDWPDYLRSLLLWPVGEVKPNQVWTLRHEFLFYLLFALSLKFRFGKAILLLYFVSPLAWWWVKDGTETTNYPWCDFVFSRCNLLFGAGYVLGIAYVKRWIVIPTMNIGFPFFIAIGALLLLYVRISEYDRLKLAGVLLTSLICVLALAISLAPKQASNTALDRIGKNIGDASYAIYLTHDVFISGMSGVIVKRAPGANLLFVCFAEVIIALIAGIAIHLWIEMPLIALIKDRVNAFGKRRLKAAVL